jgi:excisionase family DNA binding protein
MPASHESAASTTVGTYDVRDIAELLKSSTRHVRRLADSGALPRPIHLGRLVRWRKADVDGWITAGWSLGWILSLSTILMQTASPFTS